jgi:polyhydroxybutyrate depolymerase
MSPAKHLFGVAFTLSCTQLGAFLIIGTSPACSSGGSDGGGEAGGGESGDDGGAPAEGTGGRSSAGESRAGGNTGEGGNSGEGGEGLGSGGKGGDEPQPSAGCAADQSFELGTTVLSLQTESGERSYRLHLPPGYDSQLPTPLVLMFHGGGGSAKQLEEDSSGMNEVADREGFVTVYPDGTGTIQTWNAGACCGAADRKDVDDVGFVRDLLEELKNTLCLDERAIFASGMSNGAMFSHRLACELSGSLAAIAAVAGTNVSDSCVPSEPVAVLQIHGTDDGHVPFEGGVGCGPADGSFTSVPDTIQAWGESNGCDMQSDASFSAGDGSCESYRNCERGGETTLCTIEGGGHSWPGGEPNVNLVDCLDGEQSSTFPASEVIWDFFARQN